MTFLKAQWNNLIFINYEIDPNVLKPYIPKGTVLDFYKNKCYVSLVGFMFKDTKVLGLKLKNHINFEEVNLRFYVKRNEKRGVVFIKEIVPKPLISFLANTLFKEHYQTLNMQHLKLESKLYNQYGYQWKVNNNWQTISVTTEKKLHEIQDNTLDNFITEHYFGYTNNNNSTFEYEVTHSKWNKRQIIDYKIHVDFGRTYGKKFEFLNNLKPASVIFAKGSEISVKNKVRLQNLNA